MKRSHVVQLYDPPAADPDPYDPAELGWTPVGGLVAANLQPLTGSVQETAAGREVDATWKGFFPPGTPVRADQGVVVRDGPGPRAYRVRQVGEQGAPWDTEILLAETAEVIE